MKKTSLHRHENDPNIGQGGRMEDATREVDDLKRMLVDALICHMNKGVLLL